MTTTKPKPPLEKTIYGFNMRLILLGFLHEIREEEFEDLKWACANEERKVYERIVDRYVETVLESARKDGLLR